MKYKHFWYKHTYYKYLYMNIAPDKGNNWGFLASFYGKYVLLKFLGVMQTV